MVVVVAMGQAEATEPAGAMEKAAATSAVVLEPEAPAIEVEEEQAARVDSGSAETVMAAAEGMVMAVGAEGMVMAVAAEGMVMAMVAEAGT